MSRWGSVAHDMSDGRPGSTRADPGGLDRDEVHEAVAAVQVGLYVAAVRCLLTYVVAPVAGGIGVLLGPLGLLLQVLGAVTSTAGARRLWRLGHRARVPYAAVAAALCVLTATSLVQLVGEVLR